MASSPYRLMKTTLLSVLSCLCIIMLAASSLLYFNASSSSVVLRHFPSLERTRCWSSSLASSFGYSDTWSSGFVAASQPLAFGTFSHVYVVSLARRLDRRADMSRLMDGLGLERTEWSYVNATEAESCIVYDVLSSVAQLRSEQENTRNSSTENFWPADENMLLTSENLGIKRLSNPPEQECKERFGDNPWLGVQNMTCAERDNDIAPFVPGMPDYLRLTPAKIACWRSHEKAIELSISQDNAVASQTNSTDSLDTSDKSRFQPQKDLAYRGDCIDDTSQNSSPSRQQLPILVLEDDVDIERDIQARLYALWPALPEDWDIVFLGHCWSNESSYPAMASYTPSSPLPALSRRWSPLSNHHLWRSSGSPSFLDTPSRTTSLHPSSAPKCTHAYALSPRGAHRLLAHLRYKPFAYSRALDQAFAWLVSGVNNDSGGDASRVENGDGTKSIGRGRRLKAFSVVPSLIVQRKAGKSDVWMATASGDNDNGSENDGIATKGSSWKDELWDGVLIAMDRQGSDMD